LALALAIGASTAAYADGMPFTEKAPQPILTPLDKALEDAEEEPQPAPVVVTQPPPPATIEADLPPPTEQVEIAPVPVSREVEVQPNSSFFGMSVGLYDAFTHGE